MIKRINITLPEKLILETDKYCDEYMMTRSELIKNALVQFIKTDVISAKEQEKLMNEFAGENNGEALGKVPATATEQILKKPVSKVPVPEESQEPATPELKPMCEVPLCRVRSDGHYSILANMERSEQWLCPFHWNKARSEPGVEVTDAL